VPRTTYDQVNAGTPVASLDQAQPGDLVFFGSPPEHVGIYVGNGQMLDAPHTGARVRVEAVWETPSAIRRVTGSGTTGTTAAGGTTPYATEFARAGAKYGVDPKLLSALAQEESGFNPSAVSGAGAEGLMQIMPSTAASLGIDPMNPSQAIDGAARLLSGYLHSYNGSVDLALAAYSAGGGAVARYGGVPPYAETQNAIRKVRAIYGGNNA
jgi:soluble lytic murein transglycosylase-like protein